MEIVYFILGVVAVLLIVGIAIVVKVSTLAKELKARVEDQERHMNQVCDDLNRRIDIEMSDCSNRLNKSISYVDSRFDKFENKIKQKEKDLLKR